MRSIAVLACGLCGWLLTAGSHAQEFYFAGDERVPLVVSPTHRAVVAVGTPEEVERAVRLAIDASDAARTALSATSFPALLESRVLVMLRRTDAVPEEAFERAVAELVRTSPAVESEVPVYHIDGIQHALLNQFTIQFSADATERQIQAVLERIRADVISRYRSYERRYEVRLRDRGPREALNVINGLRDDEDTRRVVRWTEPNFVRYRPPDEQPVPPSGLDGAFGTCAPPTVAVASTDDTHLPKQWALERIGAFQAWNVTTGSPTEIIAVLDDGVSTAHPDLVGKIVDAFDATALGACLSVEPVDIQDPLPNATHGTEMAGIASASTDNGDGVAGVSWLAMLMPARIVDGAGAGSFRGPNIACGIKTAVARGATILNASWHYGGPSPAVTQEIEAAIMQGRTFVASAGWYRSPNPDPPLGKGVTYPGTLSAQLPVITVGGSTESDQRKEALIGADWGSAIGPGVRLIAPGECVYSSSFIRDQIPRVNNYVWSFGTSAATALVSGAAALLRAEYPTASPLAIRDWLEKGANKLSQVVPTPEIGYGRLDIAGAFAFAATPFLSLTTSATDCGISILKPMAVAEVVLRQGGMYGPPIPNATVTLTGAGIMETADTDDAGVATIRNRVDRDDRQNVVTALAAGITTSATLCGQPP